MNRRLNTSQLEPVKNYEYPMIVLINHGSAALLKSWQPPCRIGGRPSSSAQPALAKVPSNDLALRTSAGLTTAKYYTPKGKSIHTIGVQPDIIIDPKAIQVAKQKQQRIKARRVRQRPSHPKPRPTPTATQKTPMRLNHRRMYQLLKAVEMLKSWKVFKQLQPAA